ncbi:MAG TPA: hypothetical protein VK023_00320 [Sphingobacterium bovisgrunnientis]|jgi:NTP pyrophosphatase (non-canonical NTP hydrolase)|nr:hypothetical protein [Sphingobacterium bovisgrunnientis]
MINTLEKRQEVYIQAINKWGAKAQLEMALEESIELALAIRKELRKNDEKSLNDLAGEVADVKIMIEQIELMMLNSDFSKQVDQIMDFKIYRLRERLRANSFEAVKGETK